MIDHKTLTQSKTFLGLAISFVGLVLSQFGFDVTPLIGSEDLILQVGGLVLAGYGRVKAVKKVKGLL